MATYGLKYTADFRNTRGQDYRLRIYRRDYTGGSKTIGYLAGCALEVQGAQGRVIDPVVKTQLRFSVVDAWDKAETATAKYGDWQEFYTPDATLYKVVLYSLSGAGTATEMWSGYVTPDSWQEDLDYRGIITVTARDNVGHLKDFPFVADGVATPDENGLVEIRNLFTRAMQVIDFPMDYYLESAGSGQYSADVPCTEDGDYLTEALVNASLFDGMDWYEVLEQTLDSIGYAFRYVGRNRCVVESLRNLPKVGHYSEATGSQAMEFYGGNVELDPAVKKIEEEQDYKTQKEIELDIFGGVQYGAASTYRCVTEGNTLPSGGTVSVPEHDAPCNPVSGSDPYPWDTNSLLLDPGTKQPDDFLRRAEGEDGWRRYIFIAGNFKDTDTPHTWFRLVSKTAAVKLDFNFTPKPIAIKTSGSQAGYAMAPGYSLAEIKYVVNMVSINSTAVRRWNGGSWVQTNDPIVLTKTYDAQNTFSDTFEVELGECQDIQDGILVVQFYDIKYKCWSNSGHGCYARVASVTVELLGTTALQSNKVTTVNNDDYNVLLTRRPLFGALSKSMGFVRPNNYMGGLFYYPYVGSMPELYPYQARFTDQGATVPLPVLIHQQILCYYFGAARVLSGSCAPVNKAKFDFGKLCTYKGVSYLFQGGTLDLFSGIVTGAVLREYASFDELWTGTPTYEDDPSYNTESTGSGRSAGGSSGGGGGGGGSYTLPIASASTLGGVKVGSGLSIDGTTGVLSATGGGGGGSETDPVFAANGEKTANKVTSLSSSSNDTQYPSAKCVYDIVGNIESLLASL